jgi:hypothetical protein
MSEADTLIHRWIGVFNERDFDACPAIGAKAYVEHAVAPFGRSRPVPWMARRTSARRRNGCSRNSRISG